MNLAISGFCILDWLDNVYLLYEAVRPPKTEEGNNEDAQ